MFSDLLVKIANGAKLTPSEMEELRQLGNQMDANRLSVTTWSNPQDKRIAARHLDLPLASLHSQILEKNQASITLTVPSIYNTLIIIGTGLVDSANGGNIWAQVNGDTGASNYAYHLISGNGGVAGAAEDTTFHALALGVFGTSAAAAGENGGFRSELIGYSGSAWYKNCIGTTFRSDGNDQYFLGSVWKNTAPIRSIEIFGTDNTLAKGTANIVAGSYFSIWGML